MTVFQRRSFSSEKRSQLDELTVRDGDTFKSCNFAQVNPNTEILKGITDLIFEDCNLKNIKLDKTWTRKGGINTQRNMCSHLHPTKGELSECVENCSHVVEAEKITIDGEVIDTIYTYKDTRVD